VPDNSAHVAGRDQLLDEVRHVALLAQLLHHAVHRQYGSTDGGVRCVVKIEEPIRDRFRNRDYRILREQHAGQYGKNRRKRGQPIHGPPSGGSCRLSALRSSSSSGISPCA